MKKAINHSIRLLHKGDQKGLDFLYKAYHEKIYFFAIRTGLTHSEADEVVQDAFIKVWSSRQCISTEGNVQAYIYAIAKNIIFDYFKSKIKRKAAEDYQFHLLEPKNDTLQTVEHNELKLIIDETLVNLPEKRRLVFEMSRFKGLKNREIAKELGISIKTVEAHLSAALHTFKKALKRSESIHIQQLSLLPLLLAEIIF